MPEPDANADDREQRASPSQEPWHDKVLADAIGYTKGLVAILDSLSEGFQRRGRELEEQRARLTILQNERRTILEERAGFDARVAALTAERDGLRTALEERERELDRLRGDATKTQVALEAQAREIQALRLGMAEPTRQADELREIVRSLERQLQRAGQLPPRSAAAPAPKDTPPSGSTRGTPELDVTTFEEMFADRARAEDGRVVALTALIAERDGLRTALEERERELDRLRGDATKTQVALEAQAREIQALRLGMAETVRQAEEIQKVLRALEEESESAARRQAVLEEALEVERRQVREMAVRAEQEQAALREDLADAENLLAGARTNISKSQGLIGNLQRTVDEERARVTALQERLESQTLELARLNAALQAVPALLNELVQAFGGSANVSGTAAGSEQQEPGWLEALVRDRGVVDHPDAEALAILEPIREVLRDLLPAAVDGVAPPVDLAADAATLKRRAEQIADQWRQAVRGRAEAPASVGTVGPQDETPCPASEPAAESAHDLGPDALAVAPEAARAPTSDAVPQMPPREVSGAPNAAPGGPPKDLPRRVGSTSGATVECRIPEAGAEVPRILRGEIARLNDMGLLGTFEERLPEGSQVQLRFVRDGELVSCLGRVVRVQESAAGQAVPATLSHLIRFESPASASANNRPASAR